jgi:hypothetical protein
MVGKTKKVYSLVWMAISGDPEDPLKVTTIDVYGESCVNAGPMSSWIDVHAQLYVVDEVGIPATSDPDKPIPIKVFWRTLSGYGELGMVRDGSIVVGRVYATNFSDGRDYLICGMVNEGTSTHFNSCPQYPFQHVWLYNVKNVGCPSKDELTRFYNELRSIGVDVADVRTNQEFTYAVLALYLIDKIGGIDLKEEIRHELIKQGYR